MTDKEKIKAITDGDKAVFKEIFKLHYQPMCAYIRTYSHNLDLAEDIVQQTFIAIWKKRSSLNIHTSLKSYLYKSAYHNFLDSIKKDKKEAKAMAELKYRTLESEIQQSDDAMAEKIKKLKAIIERLPPRCQDVLRLKLQDYKYKEIAQELDISVKTVESQMRIAYTKIREGFGDNYRQVLFLLRVLG